MGAGTRAFKTAAVLSILEITMLFHLASLTFAFKTAAVSPVLISVRCRRRLEMSRFEGRPDLHVFPTILNEFYFGCFGEFVCFAFFCNVRVVAVVAVGASCARNHSVRSVWRNAFRVKFPRRQLTFKMY